MKLLPKYKMVALLMVISQLLLTGFTVYWLRGQYKNEKKQFTTHLGRVYSDSREEVLDSLLLKNFITPALGERAVQVFKLEGNQKAIWTGDTLKVKRHMGADSLKEERAMVTIEMKSGGDSSSTNNIDIKGLEEELLLRSVKLIVERVDDSTSVYADAGQSFHSIESGIDTAVFTGEFESRLKAEGLRVTPVWTDSNLEGGPDNHRHSRVIIVGGRSGSLPRASFTGYNGYLLGQIMPQLLFALVLILLTGSAFVISYISMRKQMVLNEIRGNLVSNISHELKTPVSTVKVALEAIRNYNLKNDREKTDEYLGIASGEILRLETLISRVLDNNMIEQGEDILRPEYTDLAVLVRDVVESVRDRAKKLGARIGVSVPPQPVELLIDPLYVRGVIFNLVDNSLKYATKEPVIEVTIIPGEGFTELSVRDNGPGIPEEYRERVFEKFFRVPGGDTHNVKGYGLGLSYVSLVMKLHGGTARVESLPGETVFTIRFEGLKG